ncbi:SMI1/KNR4 family protein [Tautonia plasticadhaerens]|uniref:SMI1 / KNR4 family protein n=1 Tax=Tautonia plasticadhaerens TaxID=2527974 RepID=A0A518H9P2_9BACT|nr:SMI1/KNR4 family protein [Tautonia plasticadhaerens]QDV37574.1 SMI1 / KNR4 family protein [Tautonia plasticadhaerens]
MEHVWDRIETWLRANAPECLASLRPGATDEQIAEAEAYLEVSFPEDVRASYRIHDGQESDGPGLLDAEEFLSLGRIRSEWAVWKGLPDGGDFDGIRSDLDEGVRDDWWNPRWIPLTYNGSGDHRCLDLDPAPGREAGQVIEMWHDEPSRPRVAGSFRSWLEGFTNDLEAGRYILSEEYGGLVERDEEE